MPPGSKGGVSAVGYVFPPHRGGGAARHFAAVRRGFARLAAETRHYSRGSSCMVEEVSWELWDKVARRAGCPVTEAETDAPPPIGSAAGQAADGAGPARPPAAVLQSARGSG